MVLEINANLMASDFQIKKINAKEDFTIKEIIAIKSQLVATAGTNLFQKWMQKKIKTEQNWAMYSTQQYAKF